MSGEGECDGPRCDDGYYINAENECSGKFYSQLLMSIASNKRCGLR